MFPPQQLACTQCGTGRTLHTVHSRPCPVVHRRDHCGEQVCIAGDPLQLNGKITSQQAAAYGLAISLQERLMCSPAYHCTDPTTPSGYRCVLVLPPGRLPCRFV